jgi:hypothetical protein
MAKPDQMIDAMKMIGESAFARCDMERFGWKFHGVTRSATRAGWDFRYRKDTAGGDHDWILAHLGEEAPPPADKRMLFGTALDSLSSQLKAKLNPLASAVLRLQEEAARLIDRMQFRAGRELLLDTMVEISAVMEEHGELTPGEKIDKYETKPPPPESSKMLEEMLCGPQWSGTPGQIFMSPRSFADLTRELNRAKPPSHLADATRYAIQSLPLVVNPYLPDDAAVIVTPGQPDRAVAIKNIGKPRKGKR